MGASMERRWWILWAVVAITALMLVPISATEATEVPTGSILVVAAHPDDDIITAAGVVAQATGDVKVAYVTNGDWCLVDQPAPLNTYCTGDSDIGTARQGEAVAAQGLLGQAESDLYFLGYPDGYLDDMASANRTETYATRGFQGQDWHTSWSGGHAAYVPNGRDNLDDDVYELIKALQPDDIFTHSRYDRHSDHRISYYAVVDAIARVQANDNAAYDPYIHATIVHFSRPAGETEPAYGSWPDPSAPLAWNVAVPHIETVSGGEILWDMRESFEVPAGMQLTNLNNNDKQDAIEAHTSQVNLDGGFIQRFVHRDEVFWIERVGSSRGRDDTYSVDEGGVVAVVAVAGPGILTNDVRGISTAGVLGPITVDSIVSGVSHGVLEWDATGWFRYTHDGSETTTDSFTYRPIQGTTTGEPATVNITINPVNESPVATSDGPYDVSHAATLNIAAPGVLDNDSDPDDDALASVLVDDVSNGSLTLNTDGSFTYTHDGSATLSDSFTYWASDGLLSSSVAIVSIDVGAFNPDPPTVTVSGSSSGAPGVVAAFTSAITNGSGPRTYDWSIADSGGTEVATGSSGSIEFTPTSGGLHTASLTVSDDIGSDSDTVDLMVMADVAGSIFKSDIVWLAEEGVTKGCTADGSEFCPDDLVTRGQMAAFLVRFLGLTDDGGGDLFTDDDGSVFEANIDKLATAGITSGCNAAGDEFCPDDFVTRGQMAAFLVRALGLTDDGGGDLFTDDDNSIFEANIDKLATAGVTKGCNAAGDEFCPNGFVTRGQMAAFLHRADGLVIL